MVVGGNLDVPGIADTPQGSVLVMTELIGLETSRIVATALESLFRSGVPLKIHGILWITSSKKHNMVCLSSGESVLMALVGGACLGIATRDQWSKMHNCSSGTVVLCTDSAAALGFVKRKGASRRTRHVDTKVYFMQAWAMELGQRILKVHGDSQ